MLSSPTDPLPLDIPEELRASVLRHQENLLRLVQSLRAAGMQEPQIEAAVNTLIDSYKQELLEAIRALKAVPAEHRKGR